MRTTLAGRAAAVLLSGVAAATALAACGGSSGNTANAAGSPTSGTRPNASAIQAYVACLGQHGVKLTLPSGRPSFTRSPRPSGAPRPSGVPRPSRSGGFGGGLGGGYGGGGFGGIFGDPNNPPAGVDAATWSAALAACRSLQPSLGGRGGSGGGFNNSAFTAYRNCLQAHGVTFSPGARGLSTTDPKVAAALATCAPLRPTGRPTAAPSPTG